MIITRFVLWLAGFLGALYAIVSLFSSLPDVGYGMAVAALSVIGWGLCDWIEER